MYKFLQSVYSVISSRGNNTNVRSYLQLHHSCQFNRVLKLKSESTVVQIIDIINSSDTESITSDRDQKIQITDCKYLLEFWGQRLRRK